MKKLLISALMLLSFSATASGVGHSWVAKNQYGQSITVQANTHREFNIKGDVWAIQTNTQFQQIRFCRMSGGNCLSSGIGLLWDWDDYIRKGYNARDFYREFLDNAERKIGEYYGDGGEAPDPSDFVAYMTYLINHGTEYNESSDTFDITK